MVHCMAAPEGYLVQGDLSYLKGVLYGIILGAVMRLVKGATRRLDCGSCKVHSAQFDHKDLQWVLLNIHMQVGVERLSCRDHHAPQ